MNIDYIKSKLEEFCTYKKSTSTITIGCSTFNLWTIKDDIFTSNSEMFTSHYKEFLLWLETNP